MLTITNHRCQVLPLHRQVFLVASSALYCFDILTDIYVTVDTLGKGPDYVNMGLLMLMFVVVPLLYSNYIAQSSRVERARFVSQDPGSVYWVDKARLRGRPVLRTLAPYAWDGAAHVVFNVLCITQLGILIDVVEMVTHRKQATSVISQQYSHYCYIRRLEVMLENCPQLLFQVCALMRDNDWINTLKSGDLTFNDFIRLSSLVFTVVALPLALCADEEAGRYCDRVSYDLLMEFTLCGVLPVNLQLILVYLGFLLIVVSRILFVALLYIFCREHLELHIPGMEYSPNLVTPLLVEAHHMLIFLMYLVDQKRAERTRSVLILEKLKRFNMVVSFFLFSFSEVFLVLLHSPRRYRRAIRTSYKEKDKGDNRFLLFYLLYLFNLAEYAVFMGVFYQDLGHGDLGLFNRAEMLGMAYCSLACFILSGFFFSFYLSPWLHPDKLKVRAPYKGMAMLGLMSYCDECKKVKKLLPVSCRTQPDVKLRDGEGASLESDISEYYSCPQ